MNKKKWVFILIGMLVLSGISWKIYLTKQQEEQRQIKKMLKVEKMSVVVLKNTFKDIKAIEFLHSEGPHPMTGSYSLWVKMMNKEKELVEFNFSFWKDRVEIGSYDVENSDIQVEGVTLNAVEVIYTNQVQEEL